MTVRRFAIFLLSLVLIAGMGIGTSQAAADRGGTGGLNGEHSLRTSVTDENFG